MFKDFATQVKEQFNKMAEGDLFVVDIDKDTMYNNYQDFYPAGTNTIYIERRSHDCDTCKRFIKRIGDVVSIIDGKLVSVWDVEGLGEYKVVTEAMSKLVKSKAIKSKFMYNEAKIGVISNIQTFEDNDRSIVWNHFNCVVPKRFVDLEYISMLDKSTSAKNSLKRALDELSTTHVGMILDLINEGNLHRGSEYKEMVQQFFDLQKEYQLLEDDLAKDMFAWNNLKVNCTKIRNSSIGTLLVDLSKGVDLTDAVNAYEFKVSAGQFKRTTTIATAAQNEKCLKLIDELGYRDSLQRRYANLNDVSVVNTIWSDKSVLNLMKDLLADLLGITTKGTKGTKGIKAITDESVIFEISIEDFINTVLPKAEGLEVLVENKHQEHLVSLIAPQNADAKNILKWANNFSISYIGDVTDAMKENVKAAGGNTEGVLRFSIQWNDKIHNLDDLDAHCITPKGHIYFGNANNGKGGTLDVDITRPEGVAVENIIFTDEKAMDEGSYKFYVNNYNHRGGSDFTAQIEFNGKIFEYSHTGRVTADIEIGVVNYSKKDGFSMKGEFKQLSKEVWGISTNTLVKVQLVCLSPNFWDDQSIGYKHYMFMLEGCKNPVETRGLYTEFLDNSLNEYRKSFEMLGYKMKCPITEDQVSGLGFGTDKRNSVIVKVKGKVSKMFKINF